MSVRRWECVGSGKSEIYENVNNSLYVCVYVGDCLYLRCRDVRFRVQVSVRVFISEACLVLQTGRAQGLRPAVQSRGSHGKGVCLCVRACVCTLEDFS